MQNGGFGIFGLFTSLVRSLGGSRGFELAVVALIASFVIVEGLHHVELSDRADFLERAKQVIVRVIRDEPRERTIVRGEETDPIVTGSTPED